MDELTSFIDRKEGEMIAFLEEIVNIDSGTFDKEGVDRVGKLLAERLAALDFSIERIPQENFGDHIIGVKPGKGEKRLLCLGHMDTVFPNGTAASRPFRIEGGRAYGPGVLDMKGGIVCLLYALEALKATGHPAYDSVAIHVVFNSEEEIGSPTSREIISDHARQAHTALVFEPAREGGEYVVQRKAVGKYTLTVLGRAAHSGVQPERGRSAIGEMAHKVIALHALTDFTIGTTVNVGVIRGGERFNVVADEAYAEIDLRAMGSTDAERADERIRAIAMSRHIPDTQGELTGGIVFPPMEQSPEANRLFGAVQEAGRALGLDLRGVSTGGGSDGNYASQFAPTVDGMGPQGSEAHSDREFIELPTLIERSKVTALFLASWPEVIATMDND